MKAFLLAILLALACHFSFGQSKEIKTLKHELAIARQDTSRSNTLREISSGYWGINSDSSLKYGNQALALAQRINYYEGEANALHVLGVLYRNLGDYPKSLEVLFKGLQIAEDKTILKSSIRCLNALGLDYTALKDYAKSIDYFKQAIKINNKLQDGYWQAQLDVNLSTSYNGNNQKDSAWFYIQKGYKKNNEINDTDLNKIIPFAMGSIQFELGDYQASFQNAHKSILISQKENDHRLLARIYNQLAASFRKLNQSDSSIYYAVKGLTEAQTIRQQLEILKSSKLLADLYEPLNPTKAMYYYRIANAANDELYGAKKTLDLQKILAEEQERQRQAESKRVAYENQLKQYAFLAGLVVLLLIAFILYRNNRQKQKANNLLHQQKTEIDLQRNKAENALSELKTTQTQLIQKEKMASLGELTAGIAHEIQNPLNFVNNFSEVSSELVTELEEEQQKPDRDSELETELLGDLKQNLQKITHHGQRASSIVKGMLEHSRTSTGERQPTDLNALADEYLRLAYQGLRAKNKTFNCELVTDFDPNLDMAEVVPQEIGRVLLNLFTNAFYAVGERSKGSQSGETYKPTVWVSTKQGQQTVEIRVKDNGTGIPDSVKAKIFQPFFTTKPTGEGTGLGLSLSYDIVTKGHGGQLTVNTEAGQFSEFVVTLPVK